MIKKVNEVLNWILVILFIALAFCGCIGVPALAFSFAIVFIVAVIIKMIENKKEKSNVIKFKRKD